MDPDTALHNIGLYANRVTAEHRATARAWNDGEIGTAVSRMETLTEYAGDLCEAVRDLDEWLRKGGALPAAWSQNRS